MYSKFYPKRNSNRISIQTQPSNSNNLPMWSSISSLSSSCVDELAGIYPDMGNGRVVGTIRENFRNERGGGFEWNIPRFLRMPVKVGECYSSPDIGILNSVWNLSIYPNGIVESSEWIRIELVRSDMGKSVHFTLGVKEVDGTVVNMVRYQRYPDHQHSYTVSKFLRRSELLNKYLLSPSGTITFSCTLWSDEPPPGVGKSILSLETPAERPSNTMYKEVVRTCLHTKGKIFVSRLTQTEELSDLTSGEKARARLDTNDKPLVSHQIRTENVSDISDRVKKLSHLDIEGGSTLRKHLKDLLLTGDDHDVILKVKHQEFRAHKNILRARSPVFAAMFNHKMKESTDGSIFIEDCDPDAFGEFLNYIYTENVEDMSPSKAVGLYYAADKYDFAGLKQMCVECLMNTSLSTTVICDVITLATVHDEDGLLETAINFFSRNTKEILTTTEWQRFVKNYFAIANEIYIKAFEKK